jgi:hypothetical protein
MRTKLNRKGRVSLPLFTAGIVLALAFTLNACGGDDSGGDDTSSSSGGNLSSSSGGSTSSSSGGDNPPSGGITNGTGSFSGAGAGDKAQTILNGDQLQQYTGNGDITIGGDVNAGKIEGGIVKLQLPSSIASTELMTIGEAFKIEEIPSSCNIPSNVKIRPVGEFRAVSMAPPIRDGYDEGYLNLIYYESSDDDNSFIEEIEFVIYIYSSGAAIAKCESEYIDEKNDEKFTISINLNLAQGWNEVYYADNYSYLRVDGKWDGSGNREYSTDKNILKHLNDMKWNLK